MSESSEIPLADSSSEIPTLEPPPRLPDETPTSRRPPPPLTPGRPLPRISRTAPLTSEEAGETAPEPESPERPARSRARPKPEKPRPREKTGDLVEETPRFDTVESRQRMRVAVGVGGVVLLVLVVWLVSSAFRSDEPTPEAEGSSGDPGVAVLPPADTSESEARLLLADARNFAKGGKEALAEDRLQRVLKAFPKSRAAVEAVEALDRRQKGLPYFLDGPAVLARPPDPPAEEPPQAVVVVEAQPPEPTRADATLRPPDHPPEPRRVTGLVMEKAEVPPKALPDGFRARPEAGVHASGWPWEITSDRDGSTMVFVPGGTFPMGRDGGPTIEGPSHQVTLSPFYVDQHEVTARQFALFLEKTGKPSPRKEEGSAEPDHPAVRASWHEAAAYAAWSGKALPTEAQWELAARTVDGRLYPWGPGPPTWDKPREPRQIDPVMSFPDDLSPYGVFDMAGNAWEWTADYYSNNYHRVYASGLATNPTGPPQPVSRPPQRTVKGVSKTWNVTAREPLKEDARLPYVGFRAVLNVEASAPGDLPGGPRPPGATGGAVPF